MFSAGSATVLFLVLCYRGSYRGEENAGEGLLLRAMLVQESEDIIRPDGGSKIAKGMAVLNVAQR
jgi:hypothetical protein